MRKHFIWIGILTIVCLACRREERMEGEDWLSYSNFPKEKALQNLKVLDKDDPDYLKSLLVIEIRNIRAGKPVDFEHVAEMGVLVNQSPSTFRKGAYHNIRAEAMKFVDHYKTYTEARAAAECFEAIRDTNGLISAYLKLGYRYPSRGNAKEVLNKQDEAAYQKKLSALLRASKLERAQINYRYMLLQSDSQFPRNIRYYEGLVHEIDSLAAKCDTCRHSRLTTRDARMVLVYAYAAKGLQRQADSLLEYNVKAAVPENEYLSINALTMHSGVRSDTLKLIKTLEKGLDAYTKNGTHDANYLSVVYSDLESFYRKYKKDVGKAYYYLKKRDSVDKIENLAVVENRMINLEGQYKLKEKDAEIANTEKSRQRFILFFLVAGILAVTAASLGYRNYRSRRRIEELYERESDIKRVISHDVLSPLTSLEMLNRRLTTTLDQQGVSTDMVKRQQLYIQNISALCQNLVGWLWHGKSDQPQATSLKTLLDDLVFELEGFLLSYDATVTLAFEGDAGDQSIADPNALRTVLRNLLTNSLRHGKSKTVVVRCEKAEKNVRIVLRDDGTPIDAELAETLQTLLNGRSEGQSMSGLGLYLAGKFLSSLKGRYTIVASVEPPFHNDHIVEIPVGNQRA